MARKPPEPPEPVLTQWCHPDTLARLPDDAARTRHHERCQDLVLTRPCPCPCHHPEEAPVVRPEPLPAAAADEPEDQSAPTPEVAVGTVYAAAEVLQRAMRGYGPEEWQDAVHLLHALRAGTELLAAVDADVSLWLYLHGEHGVNMHVEGIPGGVTIARGRERVQWPGGEGAVKDYVDHQMAALEGEMPDPHVVMRWVLDVLPASGPRVTPLRAAGLDPNDYRVSLPGKVNVTLPR